MGRNSSSDVSESTLAFFCDDTAPDTAFQNSQKSQIAQSHIELRQCITIGEHSQQCVIVPPASCLAEVYDLPFPLVERPPET